MRLPWETATSRIRYWWQTHPMAGLVVGWIAIGVVGWRIWAALRGHPG